uniref:J domain-containing protein n=1 Tax=Oryza punctata TaxID=4537 RepID=A0A0E0KJ50_ORYPU
MSWGRFHRSPFPSGIPAMARCSRHQPPAPPTVVVIDEDDDLGDGPSDEEVFIIDGDAAKGRSTSGCKTKRGNSSCSNVINLDDDEEEDKEEGGGGDRAGPSTAGAAGSPAVTTPGRVSPRNRYGLDCVSDSYESDSSEGHSDEDDDSDCEILDDASGSARKQWEKAASRKGMPQGFRKSTSTSSAESSTQPGESAENDAECDIHEYIRKYFSEDVLKEGGPISTSGANAKPSVPDAHDCSKGNASNANEAEDCNATSRIDPDPACNDEATHSQNGAVPGKTAERSQSPHIDETFEPEQCTDYSFISANRVFPACSSANWKDQSPTFVSTPEKLDEKLSDGTYARKDETPINAHNKSTTKNKEMCPEPDNGSLNGRRTEDPPLSSRCDCSRQSEKKSAHLEANCYASAATSNKNPSANVILGGCIPPQEDLVDGPEKSGQSAVAQDAADIQDGLIGEREKHKESDEYKRAQEEEWASRQRQLRIQAEEAQRLRKRKKAEAKRLLDMEKRQKQRLEEVRESQRKNEEDIQLKEKYRGVVRFELENMERRYIDMASILRALGIAVEGGEVKAAYKQALLKFHPDRVSRSDMYQQVKAEETFKFISRLKEKMLRV